MNTNTIIEKTKQELTNIFSPDQERIERLQHILEREQQRQISPEEAQEVGVALINFFELLADNPDSAAVANYCESEGT